MQLITTYLFTPINSQIELLPFNATVNLFRQANFESVFLHTSQPALCCYLKVIVSIAYCQTNLINHTMMFYTQIDLWEGSLMDKLEIEAFLAIVRHGSLTNAANSLFITQSTLTHRLAQLERTVGMKLIDRGRGLRTLSLTSNGQEFLRLARRWEELFEEAKRIRSRTKNMTLSIGAVDSIHVYKLPPVYQALIEHLKNIDIRIRTHQSTELYVLLERGEIDVAFAHLEQPMPNMIVKKFFSEPMVVTSKNKSISTDNILDDQRLDTSNEIYIEWNPSYRAWHDRWLGERKHPTIQIDTAQLLLTFLNSTEKWAIVPLSVAEKFEATGEFGIYHLEDPPPDRVCYHIRPRSPRESAVESLQILDECIKSMKM
jgi:DNA-binding transcriptional LysR family regulator